MTVTLSLIETGFFDARRVEMLEGLIWDMAGQTPIVLLDGTEPEPDVAIAPGTAFDSLRVHTSQLAAPALASGRCFCYRRP